MSVYVLLSFYHVLPALHLTETSIFAPSTRQHEWKMQPVAAQRALCRRQNTLYHGPKIGATHLEAGLLILGTVAPFLGPESGPCFGATRHKQDLFNMVSKCATAPQASSSTYPWYSEGTCPRSLLYQWFTPFVKVFSTCYEYGCSHV